MPLPLSVPVPVRVVRSLPLLLAMALPVTATATVLTGDCSTRETRWLCAGHIEVHSPHRTLRIFSYQNRETLVESEERGDHWRLIMTRKGSFVDRPVDADSASRYSPAGWGKVQAPIFLTLPIAFPDGPESVPAEPVTQTVRIDNNNTGTVTTSRGADGAIRFKIRIVGEDFAPIEGSYRDGLLPPLPGDFDLRGWHRIPDAWFEKTAPTPAPDRLEQLR